jgi:hypothetical protein
MRFPAESVLDQMPACYIMFSVTLGLISTLTLPFTCAHYIPAVQTHPLIASAAGFEAPSYSKALI